MIRFLSALLLLFAVGFNLYHLYPETASQVPLLNDGVLHQIALEQTVKALADGRNPTDFWLATITLGYPLFHHYQHLAYLPPALLSILSGQTLPLPALYAWTVYLLLSFFPLSIYWSMRRCDFDALTAALAGLLASLLATNGLFGFDYGSYVWRGSGLYTQLWGMTLLPPALAQGLVTLRSGRGWIWATLLLAATLLTHLVYGYIAVFSLGVLTVGVYKIGTIRQRLLRLALLLALVGLVTVYFWLPFWLDRAYMNRSVWEETGKYDSYGYAWVLTALTRGELFDFGRVPTLTLLAGVGLAVCLWQWREEKYRLPVILAAFWLLLYFGRPTWGPLLDFLPLSGDLHFHRLIAGVHLGGIFLIGLGLASPWQWALAHSYRATLLVLAVVTGLLLYPVYAERGAYLAQNSRWLAESQAAVTAEKEDINALLEKLRQAPPGRVYAGLGNNWGGEYRVGAVPMYALLNSAGLDTLGYLYHALALNADIVVLFDETRPEQYELFNVRYVIAPIDHPFPDFVRPIQTFGRHRLYEVTTTGYFDLVETGVAFTGGKADFYPAAAVWLNSPLVAAKQYPALLFTSEANYPFSRLPLAQASQILPQLPLSGAPPAGRITAEQIEPDLYAAQVEVQQNTTLLAKITFHPNWHTLVDGIEVKPLMVMPSFIGIPLTSGRHQVRLTYQPGPLRSNLALLGLLVLPLIALAEQRRTTLVQWASRVTKRVPSLPRRGPRDWLNPTNAGLYLLFLSIYLLSATGHFTSTDHVALYLTTQSLVQQHNLVIKPINDAVVGANGQFYSAFGVGQSVLSIPLYLLGRLVEQLSSPALKLFWSGPNLGDWEGTVPIFFVSLFNQFLSPLICLLLFHFCRRLGFSTRRAFAITLLFGLGTAAWVYAQQYFQHPLETLCLLSAIYLLFAHRHQIEPHHAFFSGLVLGLGILTRFNLLLSVLPLGCYLLYLVYQSKAENLSWKSTNSLKMVFPYLIAFALPLMGALIATAYVNHIKYGYYLSTQVGLAPNGWVSSLRYWFASLTVDGRWRLDREGWATPLWVGLYGNLLSPGRSIFLYSPPVLLALFTFPKFYQKYRAEALLCLAVVLIYLIPYSLYGHWHGGWAWGPRLLLPVIPPLLLPAGYFLDTRRGIMIALGLGILGVGVQVLGLTVNFSYIHWEWMAMGFSLQRPDYLFLPSLSPLPMHLADLLAGRNLDLWLLWLYQQYGLFVLIVTAAIPVWMLGQALALLKKLYQPEWLWLKGILSPKKPISPSENLSL